MPKINKCNDAQIEEIEDIIFKFLRTRTMNFAAKHFKYNNNTFRNKFYNRIWGLSDLEKIRRKK